MQDRGRGVSKLAETASVGTNEPELGVPAPARIENQAAAIRRPSRLEVGEVRLIRQLAKTGAVRAHDRYIRLPASEDEHERYPLAVGRKVWET